MLMCREAIEELAASLKFPLKKLYVIDGSTRWVTMWHLRSTETPSGHAPVQDCVVLRLRLMLALCWLCD